MADAEDLAGDLGQTRAQRHVEALEDDAAQLVRVGHLGDFNDLTLAGTLAGVQMGLQLAGVPVKGSGVDAALELLREP